LVNAAGGWSGAFSAKAGIRIPNTPLRREALVTEAAQPFMQAAITFYRPQEGWFNQTLRGELVAGCLAPAEEPGVNLAATARPSGAPRAPSSPRRRASAISGWCGNGPASMT
jgi:FAD dependent oxidoreductase.